MAYFPELVLGVGDPLTSRESIDRRLSLIEEAKGWAMGPDTDNREFHTIASFPPAYGLDDPFSIRLGKPGKEFDREGDKKNIYDMTPSVFKGEEDLKIRPTFKKLYLPMEAMARDDPGGAEVIGALLVRAAFMLDHDETDGGVWRYRPPEGALRYVEARTADLLGIPFRVTLHLLDAIALNEDVKYVGQGNYEPESGVGRPNNLLTSARAIATFLGRSSGASFAGDLLQIPRAIAPLDRKEFLAAYPVLKNGYTASQQPP